MVKLASWLEGGISKEIQGMYDGTRRSLVDTM